MSRVRTPASSRRICCHRMVMTPLSSAELVGLLPHRPPFRFVDAVDSCEPGTSVTARWRTTGEEAWFAWHFIDGRGLAKGLWAARGNLKAMREVVRVHRDLARLKQKQLEYPGL